MNARTAEDIRARATMRRVADTLEVSALVLGEVSRVLRRSASAVVTGPEVRRLLRAEIGQALEGLRRMSTLLDLPDEDLCGLCLSRLADARGPWLADPGPGDGDPVHRVPRK